MAYLYYMKKLLSGLLCILCSQMVLAQKDSLQFDEDNKYVYYRVVDKPGITADTLYNRAWNFAKNFNPKSMPEKGHAENALNTSGKFLVYNGISLMKKESGEISYILNIQSKDQRYRYKISSFVFTPYKRDRFGNMVPVPGMEVPLEKLSAKYSQKELDAYLKQIGEFCIGASGRLKLYMDKQPVVIKEQPVKKVITDKW
jgi:hypothetical protein